MKLPLETLPPVVVLWLMGQRVCLGGLHVPLVRQGVIGVIAQVARRLHPCDVLDRPFFV